MGLELFASIDRLAGRRKELEDSIIRVDPNSKALFDRSFFIEVRIMTANGIGG